MAPNYPLTSNILHTSRTRAFMLSCIAALAALALPDPALAQSAADTITTTCGFASNIKMILNALSIVVVTIAVIFSGYQIAFSHKRISDVAPVMIGAILIGAAGQIANMFLSGSAGSNACSATTNLITHVIAHYA